MLEEDSQGNLITLCVDCHKAAHGLGWPLAQPKNSPLKSAPLSSSPTDSKKRMPQRGTPWYWLRGLTRGVLGVFI